MDDLRESAQRVQDILQQHLLDLRVVEFKQLTRTSQEAAEAIGCQVGQIAKTLIFRGKTSQQPICVIASGATRVDEKKVSAFVGEPIEKPDADFARTHTGFAIGGIPPVGFTFERKPLIDPDLLGYEDLWAAAGTPYAVFRISPADLVEITQGQIVDIKKDS